MSWFWIIIIGICVCVAIQSFIDDNDSKNAAKAAAQLPDHLSRLLAQEFPSHAGEFTYARCQAAATWAEGKAGKNLLAPYKDWMGNVRTDAAALRGIAQLHVAHIAPIFGSPVTAMAQKDPIGFSTTFTRCLNAAEGLAGV